MLKIMNQTSSIVPQASIEGPALKAIAGTSPGAASLTGASVVDTEFAQAAGN
jgi:hypothetical protein